MTSKDLKSSLMQKVMDKAKSVVERRAQTLCALLKYEIAVANTELAMRSKKHGFDFEFIPDSYADAAVLSPAVSEEGKISMRLTIPQHAFKHASEEEIRFFKTYVLANAMTKMRNGV